MSTPTVNPPTLSNPTANSPPSSYKPTTGQSQTSEQNRHNPLSSDPKSISIPIHVECAQDEKLNETFKLCTNYVKSTTIGVIIKRATKILNAVHKPLQLSAIGFSGKSFISHANTPKSLQNPLTNYNRNHLTGSGLNLQVVLKKYVHNINYNPITCKYMLKYHTKHNQYIPEKCPMYNAMKNQYTYEYSHLLHLRNYNHFINEFGSQGKPPCRYASECRAFIRLDNDGLNFNDLCHMQLYRHPPRQNIINLKPNINPLLINTENDQNYPIYTPNENDQKKYNFTEKNGYVKALIQEVIKNGYEECLHMDDADDDDDEKNDQTYSLMTIVHEKINSLRHKKMNSPLDLGEMLSLILYTGTDCNYSLCNKQRNGHYKFWKWFDYCLFNGIRKLSISETAEYKLYSGLSKVKLNKKIVNEGFFKTYVSSSWSLKVAKSFLKTEGGMVIILDKEFRKHTYCCDVSWISKFPDECEILIGRSVQGGFRNNFSLKIIEQDLLNNIQIVSLYYKST